MSTVFVLKSFLDQTDSFWWESEVLGVVLALGFGLALGMGTGLLWGLMLGLLQFGLIILLEKVYLAHPFDPLFYRMLVGLTSVTLSMAFVGTMSYMWAGDLRGLLPDSFFFLPSIIATITFATIAVKTVSWAASERKVAMMSRAASERVEAGHN